LLNDDIEALERLSVGLDHGDAGVLGAFVVDKGVLALHHDLTDGSKLSKVALKVVSRAVAGDSSNVDLGVLLVDRLVITMS